MIIPASSILEKLRLQYGATLEPSDQTGGWYKVTRVGNQTGDRAIYLALKPVWRAIAGQFWGQCALLLAISGRQAGVWVHVWPPWENQYEAGPDEVATLDY